MRISEKLQDMREDTLLVLIIKVNEHLQVPIRTIFIYYSCPVLMHVVTPIVDFHDIATTRSIELMSQQSFLVVVTEKVVHRQRFAY